MSCGINFNIPDRYTRIEHPPRGGWRLKAGEPGGGVGMDEGIGGAMRCVALAVGVGNFALVPAPHQKGFATGGGVEGQHVFEVVALHDEDEVCPAGVLDLDLPCPVRLHGHAQLVHDEERRVIGRMIDQRANAGGTHVGFSPRQGDFMAKQVFRNRTAADVSGANSKNVVEHGRFCTEGGKGSYVTRSRHRLA